MVLAHNLMEGARTRDIEISVDVTFDSMLLSNNTLEGLKTSGFYKPSPIQLHGIPLGKCGFDLFLEAKSGTGKTAVFTVIALEKIDLDKALQTVILTPTREIAAQITDVIKQIGSKYIGLNVEVVMGGLPVEEDIEKFQKKVHIVVGSPGRMRHLIQKKYIDVSAVRLLVLDEADKLMDRSFKADINYIFSILPKQKQVIMSSATYPDTLKDILQNYVQKAQHICPDSTNILLGIKQFVTTVKSNMNIVVQTQNRFEELLKILSTIEFKQCLIFCNYQVRVGELCKMLVQKKWPADKLHGQLEQTERLDALKTLKEYKCRILVSTDLAARGIDASNVNLVINFEPPSDWQTYLHRIGRAGRFGSYGIAVSIVSEGKELENLKKTIRTISHSLKINYLSNGNELSDYDEIDESQENEKCKISKTEEISKTSQIEGVTTIPSVEDIHEVLEVGKINNSNIKKMSETPQVELSCETSDTVDSKCKTLETEKVKLLNTKKETFNDHCNELAEIPKYQALENSNVEDKNFAKIFFSNEASEQIKLESFNDLMDSFKVHDTESNEAIAVQDDTFKTYFDSGSNAESYPNILLELQGDTDCETDKMKSKNIVNEKSKISDDHTFLNSCQASPTSYDDDNIINKKSKTPDDHTLLNSSEVSPSSNNDDNIINKKSKIPDDHTLLNSSEVSPSSNNDDIIINKKSKTPDDHTILNSSQASPTSNGDDGYNTHSCLYSRSTKSVPPKIKEKIDVESIYSKKSNKGMELRSDISSKYNNWYKQFKAHMQLIEMSLYIEELSKM
ncbi:unnamed protein product [Arctia plantaginis]|uniref:RNA helicase n=1 Tax=Arctia plantaginis TaxID=874455 RepID=A0A8S1AYJ6_ARCPL|nr:unnamed protein product [Arctia plantaginis]